MDHPGGEKDKSTFLILKRLPEKRRGRNQTTFGAGGREAIREIHWKGIDRGQGRYNYESGVAWKVGT